MNKKIIFIIAIAVAVGAAILLWRMNSDQNSLTQRITDAQSTMTTDLSTEVAVSITNYSFQPSVIKIKKGAKVIWKNSDNASHTVTSDQGKYLDSPLLKQNETYEKIFDTSGVFRYHCTPHPGMTAAVIVE